MSSKGAKIFAQQSGISYQLALDPVETLKKNSKVSSELKKSKQRA